MMCDKKPFENNFFLFFSFWLRATLQRKIARINKEPVVMSLDSKYACELQLTLSV